ncbi:MAG: long-chain-fatty-acid--CoA ligase [Acidobacteria bacterium]|nr:long-chain-fatty-acid--CoA ligase [Acidobacteriota bacterium]
MFVPLTPLRFLHRAADVFGHHTAIVSGERTFTYAEFGERAQRLASALEALGVQPGDRVAFISFNNNALMEGYYGVIQARAIVMPLNVRLSQQEMTGILNHAGAKVVFFENDFAPLVESLKSDCGSVSRWISIEDEYDALLAAAESKRADVFSYDESSIAELFYTSGSTGTPKGVMLSHRTLYLHALDIITGFRELESMVDLHTIPLFHANGWGRPQMSTMLGVKQVMVRRFEPGQVFRLIAEHKATHMCLVPTMANALLNHPELGQHDTTSLKQIMIGGAAASPELVQRLEKAFGCMVCCGYGMTETAPVLTTSSPKRGVTPATDADRARRHAMAGWPVPGVEVRVVDSNLEDVPRDMESIGEVIARGDHIMDGYYREPEQTAAVMSGAWIHTGDMAVWDNEGFVHIVDRKKEIIISGGENISSIEIEKAIFAHESVLECAVVAAPDEKWGEVPAAIVVRKPGAELSEEALLAFLGERLGRFKLPRVIRFSEEALPKTGTGKIRKNILRESFWAGRGKRVQG